MGTENPNYFEIGIFHPKHGENIGTLWRTAYQLGAAGILRSAGLSPVSTVTPKMFGSTSHTAGSPLLMNSSQPFHLAAN